MHTIQRVQTQSSTRALTGIGAEVNLLIASSQFQVTAYYSGGGGGRREGGVDNEPATDKDRRVYTMLLRTGIESHTLLG